LRNSYIVIHIWGYRILWNKACIVRKMFESTYIEITYTWWGRVIVFHVIVGDVNVMVVLWTTLHSNVPGWWNYISLTTLAMASSKLEQRNDKTEVDEHEP
jgi:hypothetical protein